MLGAVAGPLDDELVGTVKEAVERAVGEGGVGEEDELLAHVAGRGDDEPGAAIGRDYPVWPMRTVWAPKSDGIVVPHSPPNGDCESGRCSQLASASLGK